MNLAYVVIEDYPFHDAVFPYEIPSEFENKIGFGVLLLVPFGTHNQPRLGVVIDYSKTDDSIENVKPIFQVVATQAIQTKQYKMLKALSVFYQVPLSKCLTLAGLFPKSAKPKPWYISLIESETALIGFKNAKAIFRYLSKHHEGFDPILFRRRFHLTQNTTILKKLEKRGLIQKKYLTSPCQLPSHSSPARSKKAPCWVVNGINRDDRVNLYIQHIREYNRKQVLVITPSQASQDELQRLFDRSEISDRIHLGSKIELLKTQPSWDLIIIENSTSQEYQLDMPFSFHQEKIALLRSKIDGIPLIIGSYLPSLFIYSLIQSGRCQHLNKQQTPSLQHPKIVIRSMNQEIVKHGFHLIPFTLQGEINRQIQEGKKTLILLNRKGYVNILHCKYCSSWIVCPTCGAPMGLLSDKKTTRCRNCNETSIYSPICPQCGHAEIRMASFGTEKIEEEAKKRYPTLKIIRIDKNQLPISSSEMMESDLVIGTTLTLNRVDWDSINFCCLLGIDARMNYPVYHNQSDIFFLFSHLSEKLQSVGKERKKILVFSFTPMAELFQWLTPGRFKLFYDNELMTRKEWHYPPYTHLIEWHLQSLEREELKQQTESVLSFLSAYSDRITCLPAKLEKSFQGIYSSRIQFKTKDLWNLFPFFCVKIDELKKNEKIMLDVKKWEW